MSLPLSSALSGFTSCGTVGAGACWVESRTWRPDSQRVLARHFYLGHPFNFSKPKRLAAECLWPFVRFLFVHFAVDSRREPEWSIQGETDLPPSLLQEGSACGVSFEVRLGTAYFSSARSGSAGT